MMFIYFLVSKIFLGLDHLVFKVMTPTSSNCTCRIRLLFIEKANLKSHVVFVSHTPTKDFGIFSGTNTEIPASFSLDK